MDKKTIILGLGVALALVLGVVGLVSDKPVQEKIVECNAETGECFGSTRYPNGVISTYFETADTVGGPLAATSTFGYGAYVINGVDYWSVSGTFNDASSTLATVHNPFSTATTTAYLSYIDITGGASTSQNLYIATSSSQYLGEVPLDCTTSGLKVCAGILIDEGLLGTSTKASNDGNGEANYATMFANGSSLATLTGRNVPIGGTSAPLIVGPGEFVVIYATSTYGLIDATPQAAHLTCGAAAGGCADGGSDGITNAGNTFDGSYTLTYIKP